MCFPDVSILLCIIQNFVKVMPRDYKAVLIKNAQAASGDAAALAAPPVTEGKTQVCTPISISWMPLA